MEYFEGLPEWVRLYWWGVFGSVFVELSAFARGVADESGQIPPRFKTRVHIAIQLIFPFFAGALPVIFEASNALTSVYLGAAAPVIIDRLAKGAITGSGGGAPIQSTASVMLTEESDKAGEASEARQ